MTDAVHGCPCLGRRDHAVDTLLTCATVLGAREVVDSAEMGVAA